ncbi:MAG: N-6 DNA methylase, partial [Promethearchaeota archaeon]
MKKDFTLEQINQGDKKKNRRNFGEHFTSIKIFKEYIFPAINSCLYDFSFIDLYCGEGNLILPILDEIPDQERNDYFKAHIFLRDIQPECIENARIKAQKYGISADLANKNIKTWDSLSQFPPELKKLSFPIFHITNPPYLYLGYIRKHTDTQKYLPLFEGANQGYQDLYQIALINDFRTQISKLIYIIPTNFLFGNSVSNKFRDDFLPYYEIEQSI